jgi:hypothetical protein
MKKEERLRLEREPKIKHVLDNSQESKMVATISDKLSKEIAAQSAQIELISQRLIWALRGLGQRLLRNSCNIPFTERSFVRAAEHLLNLVEEMRASVNGSRSSLMAEMQGDEGAADCLIWRNASKEYKRQARDLDDQMRELIMLAKVAKRMLKEVIKVCKRGQRQDMYANSHNMHTRNTSLARTMSEELDQNVQGDKTTNDPGSPSGVPVPNSKKFSLIRLGSWNPVATGQRPNSGEETAVSTLHRISTMFGFGNRGQSTREDRSQHRRISFVEE